VALHIIIDGYNLIHHLNRQRSPSPDLQSLRQGLIEVLSVYKKKKHHRITVVFDGTNAPVIWQHRDRIKGIDVKFSSNGESADTVIKRMAARERQKILVVSSDREILDFATSSGAATISSPHFFEKLIIATADPIKSFNSGNKGSKSSPTKKKGPHRRFSKRERRNRLKTNKL
jgi:predicted RNA-binding protein with PIN domain